MSDATAIRPYEIGEKLGALLPSQRAFIGSSARFSAISGGFASGKSRSLCTKGLLLSAAIPGNVGMFLRYRGTDVEKLLLPLFMDEVCPPAWIRQYHKKSRTVVLRNNSVISFEHLHDAGAGSGAKTRRLGANLGWFGIDQGEEIAPEHWDAMISRLRLPRAPKKFGFMALNPGGRDWIYERFFKSARPWPRDENNRALPLNGKYFQQLNVSDDTAAFIVNSEENRISNGGFVEDKFFDSLLQKYGQAWIERFVYSQFDDFKGKMFPDYEAGLHDDTLASVHNIEPFPIPRHWFCINGIDVGGDSPWCVQPTYVDEQGNLIVTDGFHGRTGRVREVAAWMKNHTPYNETRCINIIDPENLPVRVELGDYGIYCQTADKAINPGLLRLDGYIHIQKYKKLPRWYQETQPAHKYVKFKDSGSPQVFFFNSDIVVRKEFDQVKWHPDKPDTMFKTSTMRFDTIETMRYIAMSRPEASKELVADDKYAEMEKLDPASAREWRERDRRLATLSGKMKTPLRDMDSEESSHNVFTSKKYDFTVREEF